MRIRFTAVLSFVFAGFCGQDLRAQDYLKEDGRLAEPFKLVQLQGGFAGYTGVQYSIAPDGVWMMDSVFNQKKTLKNKGKLSPVDLMKLNKILEKYDLAKLPPKSGKQPGANPHTITFEFGAMRATLVGQTRPKRDPQDPTASVASRFAGIWDEVVELMAPKKK